MGEEYAKLTAEAESKKLGLFGDVHAVNVCQDGDDDDDYEDAGVGGVGVGEGLITVLGVVVPLLQDNNIRRAGKIDINFLFIIIYILLKYFTSYLFSKE